MTPVGGRYALRCAMPLVGAPRLGFGVGGGGASGWGGGGLCFGYGLKVSKQVTLLVKTVCCMACQEWNKVQKKREKKYLTSLSSSHPQQHKVWVSVCSKVSSTHCHQLYADFSTRAVAERNDKLAVAGLGGGEEAEEYVKTVPGGGSSVPLFSCRLPWFSGARGCGQSRTTTVTAV